MAGYADKVYGRTIPVSNGSFHSYSLHEPVGVVGQVVPWNFPLLMMAWKVAPAIAMVSLICYYFVYLFGWVFVCIFLVMLYFLLTGILMYLCVHTF